MKKRLLPISFIVLMCCFSTSGSAFVSDSKGIHPTEDSYLFKSAQLTVSHLYPNPAFDYVDIDVQVNANFSEIKLVIFNILGQEVKVVNLDSNLRTQRINLRELNPGMYPYQLVVDGKSLVTKKLIVK
ncbi:MAG: hypothetical protein RI995_1862 [Bacteroidota bacterium]